jgi:hypothetical protein
MTMEQKNKILLLQKTSSVIENSAKSWCCKRKQKKQEKIAETQKN